MITLIKERPIIFSGEMVRAILEGRKTQTRRTIKYLRRERMMPSRIFHEGIKYTAKCPYGQPGDRLWVRETWHGSTNERLAKEPEHPMDTLSYKAEFEGINVNWKWYSPIHMPRWASRIALEITSVRVERLQEISEEDALKEGAMHWWNHLIHDKRLRLYNGGHGPVSAYQMLWESINGKGSWKQNPFVWVIEFKPINAEKI